MQRKNNRDERCHSQTFSCTDGLINEFDLNSKNFEVKDIKLKLKAKELESSNINTRSREIKKFILKFNEESNKMYEREKK